MSIATDAVLDEKVWEAWLAKSRLREQATARKMKIAGGIFLILLVFAFAFYHMGAV